MNLLSKCVALALTTALAVPAALADGAPRGFTLVTRASIETSTTIGATAAEIVAYDAKSARAFAINSQENELVVIDLKPLRSGGAPVIAGKLSFAAYGAGLNSVAVAVGEDASTLEDVHEPFLVMQGFIKRTPRGRVAMPAAYRKLGLIPPTTAQSELFGA